jgi:S-adenosylmethionine uptake transporter
MDRRYLPTLAALLGIALFGAMDGLMKAASAEVGAYSAMMWRCLIGALLMLPLWLAARGGWPGRAALRVHLLRSLVVAAMAVLFFWGLVRTPMAEAIGISFIAPLLALYLAAVLLKERIAGKAIVASLVGIGGVAIICLRKLGAEFDAEARLGVAAILASAVLYALNLILQRRQAQVADPRENAFLQSGLVFAILAIGSPFLGSWPAAGSWWLLGGAAVLSVASLMLLSWAYARAEAQALLPIEYSAFIWAALIGWLAFGEQVTAETIIGVALIVGACLIAARRGSTEQTAL